MAHTQFLQPAIDSSPAHARSGSNPIAVMVATCAALVLVCFYRRPEMFFNPQLWAEDGPIFFVQADVIGHGAIFQPYAGYLHLLPRLLATFAALLPAGWIPAAYFTCCMGALAVVVVSLFSPRIDLPWKPALALAPVLVPHSGEAIGNLTNLQWVVALMLILRLVAHDAVTVRQHCTDLLTTVLIGLTGVFSTILAPLFVWRALQRRTAASVALASAVCLTGIWQGWMVFHSTSAMPEPVRLAPADGVQLVALRMSTSLLLPPSLAEQLPRRILTGIGILTVTALFVTALWPGSRQQARFALVFSAMGIAAAALYRFRHGDFGALFSVSMGDRYFFLPKVVLLWLLILGAVQNHAARWLAITACGAAWISTALHWHYERWEDFHWTAYAAHIQAGRRTTDIPLNPQGFKFDYPGRRGGR